MRDSLSSTFQVKVASDHRLACTASEVLAGKTQLCSAALHEARRFAASAMFSSLYGQLIQRIAEMLEELDKLVLQVDRASDHGVFEQVAFLRRDFEEIQTRHERLGI